MFGKEETKMTFTDDMFAWVENSRGYTKKLE